MHAAGEIFAHLQRLHVGFFDRNPVGRLITRLTSDVDALNEMFTSGVVAIFGDVITLLGIMGVLLWSWTGRLALVTFAVLPLLFWLSLWFRERRAGQLPPGAHPPRPHQHVPPGSHHRHVGAAGHEPRGAQPRASSTSSTATTPRPTCESIFYYAMFYPVVEFFSALALALVIWVGGEQILERRLHPGRAGGLHPVRAPLLPAHPGSEREVQHPAGGHGGERAHLQPARHAAPRSWIPTAAVPLPETAATRR